MEQKKRMSTQEIVLRTVAVAGLISLAVVAPGAVGAMAKMGILPSRRQRQHIVTARDRLIKKGLIKLQEGKARLTPAGEAQLRRLQILNYRLKKPKRWDKKWRVLIFDIPERRKSTRNRVRMTLIRLGFSRLQDSVWVYPYPCENLISLLKADFKIGRDMQYLVVERIEYDRALREQFSLSE